MKVKLTAVEYELMSALWDLGQASVREVMECLPKNRKLAYTSVATILRILQNKKVVRCITSDRTHIFVPKISKLAFIKETTSSIISELFAGKPLELVAHLINHNTITKEEISTIKKMMQDKFDEVDL